MILGLDRFRRRWVVGAVASIGVAGVGVAGWLTAGVGAGADDEPDAGDDHVLATVEHRVLESVVVARGTVVSSSVATVHASEPGEDENAVAVTGLAGSLGDEVGAGDVLVELNARPVLALPGPLPSFRDIRPGDVGPDVEALQVALESMGHPIPDAERAAFGRETRAAVEAVYASAGYDPPFTLGDEAAVDTAIAAADATVAVARTVLDEAIAVPAEEGGPRRGDVASARAELAVAEDELRRVVETEGVMVVASEMLAVDRLPATIVDLPVAVGQHLEPGASVVSVGSGVLQVDIALTGAQVRSMDADPEITVASGAYEARCVPGDPVAVDGSGPAGDEDSEGGTDDGGDVGGGSSDADAHGEYRMSVTCDPPPPLEQLGETLPVTLVGARSDGPVSVVPSTAIVVDATGDAYVEVVGPDGDLDRVAVEVGAEAGGFNAVEPVDGRLNEGDAVRVRRA